MSNFYNIFGEYKTSKNIETFADTKSISDRINELSSILKSGEIKEEDIKKEIAALQVLEKEGKFSKDEKKSFDELIKNNVRMTDGINLIGNLELGGIIKARGFHLADGTEVTKVIQEKEKLAIPLDKDGNINLEPPKGKKMNISEVNINNNLNIPKSGRISFGLGEDNDPYHLRKIGNDDANHLRLTLNDGNNESLQIWGDSCKTDKCSVDGGTMKHAFFSNGNAHHKGDIIMDGGNNWIFHTPDDGRHHLYIAPSKTKGKGDWNWNNQFRLQNDGSAHVHGSLNVRNPKNGNNPSGGGTHFNHKGQGLNYIRGKTEMRGEFNYVDPTKGINITNAKNGNNPSGGGTHFNHKGQGLNYIRGKTEMRGEFNYVDPTKGINITNAKNANNPAGHGTHFNYQGKGLNYIRGKTEMKGEVNYVDPTKGINITNAKNANNPAGHGTHFNYRGLGLNYIRGKTEMKGEFNYVDSTKGINITNAKNGNNPSGHGTHFNLQGNGLNYIRGTTEIKGPNISLLTDKGISVSSQGKVASFGSANSSWCHITTNAPQFYMNKPLQVNGSISAYNNQPLKADKGVNAPSFTRIGGDWLRINPEGNSIGRVAVYGGFSINDVRGGKAGLGVGYWGYPGKGNIQATGKITCGNGMNVSGGRTHFKDAENKGRLRVGAAYGVPGLYSEDNQDIVVGAHPSKSVHLGRPNLVRIDGNGNIFLPGNANIFIGNKKVAKNGDSLTLRSNRSGKRLYDGNRDARFENHNRGAHEKLFLELF